jgi:hypothetical protein
VPNAFATRRNCTRLRKPCCVLNSASYAAGRSNQEKRPAAQSEEDAKARLDQCMASWDKGTHNSQSSWRQICNREIKANE